MRNLLVISSVLVILLAANLPSAIQAGGDATVFIKVGDLVKSTSYKPSTKYQVEGQSSYFCITIAEIGAYPILKIFNEKHGEILRENEVTGVMPVGEEKYFFSLGPIYNNSPGIYMYNAIANEKAIIVEPKVKYGDSKYYSDYFEIYKLDLDKSVLHFYYGQENEIDFNFFRSEKYHKSIDVQKYLGE